MDRVNVLYLDDEVNNLESFKAKFRKDYTIFLALTPSEAFKILSENNDIQVVISDQRMPEMTGIDFFESLIVHFPNPVRILLTGYSDLQSVIAAINKGQVYRYIEKPWNDYEMKLAIENAFQFHFVNYQLKKKNEELQKKNEELNRFAYSASHDLKAPVKSMQGILNLAKMERNSEDELINLLGISINKLDYFINNISDYYKNSQSEKKYSEIDLKKIVQDSIEIIEESHNCNVNDIDISVTINQTTSYVNDEFRLQVIISYLLSNAIKYQRGTEKNKKIDIAMVISEDSLKFTITDNGIGISEQYKEHIYKMFYRATTQSTGSGIGLYIVKETLSKIDGTIKMTSVEHAGTTFEIEIPNWKNNA